MSLIFTIFVVIITSALGYAISRAGPVNASFLWRAIRALFAWTGVFVVFITSNVTIGGAIIALTRILGARFIGIYDLHNVFLLILSAAQAFVFQMWWNHE